MPRVPGLTAIICNGVRLTYILPMRNGPDYARLYRVYYKKMKLLSKKNQFSPKFCSNIVQKQ